MRNYYQSAKEILGTKRESLIVEKTIKAGNKEKVRKKEKRNEEKTKKGSKKRKKERS